MPKTLNHQFSENPLVMSNLHDRLADFAVSPDHPPSQYRFPPNCARQQVKLKLAITLCPY